jgi:hypothetical protein
VNQQRPKVWITALADAQQPILAAGTVLPWRKAKCGGHLPTFRKLFAIANRRY